MPAISAAQIRAARAMLDWSMLDLAEAARVSISTVKRFEGQDAQPVSDDLVAMLQDAAETEGVRFLADDGSGPGVRLRRRQGGIDDLNKKGRCTSRRAAQV